VNDEYQAGNSLTERDVSPSLKNPSPTNKRLLFMVIPGLERVAAKRTGEVISFNGVLFVVCQLLLTPIPSPLTPFI
jgi:hypothetical protein